VYRVKTKRLTPAADWAGVGSLNHAAMARKYAFITNVIMMTRRKKMLAPKRELINFEEITREGTHKN
jgi:hypothetical protein